MKRLDAGSYRDLHYFVSDVHLTFNNAMTFNPKNSDVFMLSKNLKREFDIKYKQKISEFEKSIETLRKYFEYLYVYCLKCNIHVIITAIRKHA